MGTPADPRPAASREALASVTSSTPATVAEAPALPVLEAPEEPARPPAQPADASGAAPRDTSSGAGREAPGEVARAPLEAIVPPSPPLPPIPGAYLAPSAVVRSAPVVAPPVVTVPVVSAASASAAQGSAAGLTSDRPLTPREGAPDRAGDGRSLRAPVLELPFVLAPGPGSRLVATGALLAAAAFVLQWVPGGALVIGGASGSGYFSTWGLAAVANLLPFLLAIVILALAVLPNRVPRLAALGLLPVVLGGILAGIAWTYLIGPAGTGIGIWTLAVAALLLVVGGSLGLLADRPDA